MNFTKQLPRWIMNAVVTLLGALGAVFCVTTAFDIPVEPGIIVIASAVSCLIFSVCFQKKKYLWLLLGLCAIMAVLSLFTSVFEPIPPTIVQLVHDILSRFSSAYRNLSFAIPAEPEAYSPQSNTLLFTLLGILLSVWLTWGVGYRSGLITVAGTLPFLLLCVIINDTPPHVVPLVMMLAAWLTVLLCKERHQEPPAMDAARLGITLMAVLLLLSVVGTVYPKDDTRDRELPELVQNVLDMLPDSLQNLLSRDSNGVHDDELGADTDEVLDLTTQGTRDRKDTVMMRVSSTQDGVLYLRGAAKDIYTGTSWESKNGASAADSVYAHTSLGAALGDSFQAAVEVHNYQTSADVAFVPYGFLSCTGAEEIQSDLRIQCITDNYITYFWPGLYTLDLTEPVAEPNTSYEAYVQETCLELPEDTGKALYDLALSYGYDPELSTLDTIAWVAEFVRTVGTYQLNVSRQPTNFDFAVYFLTESKAGYCVHFATAAATMCRALGIPARYASGYRATVSEVGTITDVTDEDTHAWAEIYLSGFGWLPLEATPGFGESLTLPQVDHNPAPLDAEELDLPEDPEPEPSQEPETESEPSEVPASPEPSETVPSESPVPESAPLPGSSGGRNALWLLLILPGVLILGILILLIRHRIVVRRRLRRFQRGGTNARVIAQWQYLEKLKPYGAEPEKALEALALKAKFSQHQLTQEELDSFSGWTRTLALETRKKLAKWQRLRFVWLSCLDLKKK